MVCTWAISWLAFLSMGNLSLASSLSVQLAENFYRVFPWLLAEQIYGPTFLLQIKPEVQIQRINNAVQTCPQQYSLYLSLLKVWEEKLVKARYLMWENYSHAFVPTLEAEEQSCCAFPQTSCCSSGKLQVPCLWKGAKMPILPCRLMCGKYTSSTTVLEVTPS